MCYGSFERGRSAREYPAHFDPIGDDKLSIVAIVEGAEFGERPIDESDIRRLADFFHHNNRNS